MKTKDWTDAEIRELFSIWWRHQGDKQGENEMIELDAFAAGFKLAAAMWNN